MKHGIVHRETKSLFRYQGWPTVCTDENGILYVGVSGHRLGHICPFGKDWMFISYDGGDTWSAPRVVNDTLLDDRDAGLTALGNGKLLLSWFNLKPQFYWNMEKNILEHQVASEASAVAKGMMDCWRSLPEDQIPAGSFVRLSRDMGEHWEEAVRVPVSAPHGPARLKNGKLIYLGRYFDGMGCENEKTIAAFGSDDDGKTWELLGEVDMPEGIGHDSYHEPHVLELPDGSLLGAIRVQGPGVFTIHLCNSSDGGKTWTMPRPSGVTNGSPPHLMLHSSGAVIMTYACRAIGVGYGQKCRLSYDGGNTWGDEIVLAEAKDPDQGYPSTVELPDGSLITVYYQKYEGDRNCSTLYTKWSLDEVKA